jgi:hypothetical protein
MACIASASASCRSPAPSERATAEATPPPHPTVPDEQGCHREDRRNSCQRIGAEAAQKENLADRDERLHEDLGKTRRRKPYQHSRNRSLKRARDLDIDRLRPCDCRRRQRFCHGRLLRRTRRSNSYNQKERSERYSPAFSSQTGPCKSRTGDQLAAFTGFPELHSHK